MATERERPEKYLGESDWDDIDLLTTDEATERLDEEIAELRAWLGGNGVDVDVDDADDVDARRRLASLEDTRERLAGRRTFRLPKA